ncbi:ABC transporter permease [Dactylosporangium sp. AC04546]|uniref:ABC transporter permease n=1 Tax=Dactylosporangium sp. AC04546 TaxID=2862460 RepID=UPI001EE016D8|nr:ABC transporter permease [Dactylosporangium sp. AC04546]WVK80859.1 ABC transporter permease [Dactylosporangium sp. AC04546]
MGSFLLRRVLLGALTLFAVSVVTFTMFFALPRDPATAMCPKNCDAQRLERVRTELGLNDPKPKQYLRYMSGVFVGRENCPAPCLGYSYVNNEPVSQTFGRVIPVTLSIVIPASVLWLALGIGLGMLSALRRGTVFDRLAIGFSLSGASMQLYFVGGVLLLVFVYTLKVLPYPHYTPLLSDPLGWFTALVLPWCTLAFLFSAVYARLSRAQMLETMSEDFVRTAMAKGLRQRTVVRRHVLRAAITPLVTTAGLDIGTALGGTVITETTFGFRGLGRTAIDAVRDGDLPTIMGTVLLAATFIVVANIVVDALYTTIDPRIRLR